jgi:hypothetical protein
MQNKKKEEEEMGEREIRVQLLGYKLNIIDGFIDDNISLVISSVIMICHFCFYFFHSISNCNSLDIEGNNEIIFHR